MNAAGRDAVRDVALFERVATVLAGHVDTVAALDEILRVFSDAFEIAAAWVWLIDPETSRFYLAASRGLPPLLQEPVKMTGEPCWCLDAFVDGDFVSKNVRTVDCSRLRNAARDAAGEGTAGLKYHASVLLRFGNRQLGILNLSRADWHPLSADDLALLAALGSQIGLALERSRLALAATAVARTDERARLAREIHDTLAQEFTAVALALEGSLRVLEREPQTARARIETALEVVRRSLDDARDAVAMLRSDPLGGRTLSSALGALARAFASETGVVTAIHPDGSDEAPYAVECEFYRVASEALQNVRKHAGARRVDIRLVRADGWFDLLIEDDGTWKAVDGSAPHFGIVGMTERMQALAGTLVVESRDGSGTRVRARVPLVR